MFDAVPATARDAHLHPAWRKVIALTALMRALLRAQQLQEHARQTFAFVLLLDADVAVRSPRTATPLDAMLAALGNASLGMTLGGVVG